MILTFWLVSPLPPGSWQAMEIRTGQDGEGTRVVEEPTGAHLEGALPDLQSALRTKGLQQLTLNADSGDAVRYLLEQHFKGTEVWW